MRRLKPLLLVLLIGVGCSSSTPTANPPDVVSIASDFPLSGNFSAASHSEAVAFAVAQASSVGSYHLAVRSFDDSLAGYPDAIKGVQNVRRMLQDPRVVGMVGPHLSAVAAEEIPVASAGQLAMVSASTTFNCLTLRLPGCRLPPRPGGRNNFFRIAATDDSQGAAMADYAFKTLRLTRVAVLRQGDVYGSSLVAGFDREFTSQGGTVTQNELYQATTNDFSEVLNRAANSHAQAIYVGGTPGYGACRIRAQMAGILSDAYFLGGDALIEPPCISDAGRMANEHMVVTVAVPQPDLNDPRAKNYLKSHAKPDVEAFAAYDCALILVDAVKRVVEANHGRLPSREQVLTAVATTAGLKGITGTWSFDANGDATVPGISFHRVQGGRWILWRSDSVGTAPS
jgi:branched-chain amino acid transport system substrate-binding protein